MKAYELLFFVSPTIEDEVREATLAKVDSTITNLGGVIDNVDEWGKRKLAYEVGKLTDGDYYLYEFHARPRSIKELSRILRITDAIPRFLVSKKTN
ncbi:MAG: 30S ribosomal protein S6 [Coriobacteriales bacterium]|jgi:small subunit ribosomal protein S6|nr:30S ribosomal protein S6 [Coriobacteriales bacterium]